MLTMRDMFPDEDTLRVFETVVDSKRVDLRAIREQLGMQEDTTRNILDHLVGDGLLERISGPLPDFNTYFPSAKGLSAQRQIKATRRFTAQL